MFFSLLLVSFSRLLSQIFYYRYSYIYVDAAYMYATIYLSIYISTHTYVKTLEFSTQYRNFSVARACAILPSTFGKHIRYANMKRCPFTQESSHRTPPIKHTPARYQNDSSQCFTTIAEIPTFLGIQRPHKLVLCLRISRGEAQRRLPGKTTFGDRLACQPTFVPQRATSTRRLLRHQRPPLLHGPVLPAPIGPPVRTPLTRDTLNQLQLH